mmetsp:Transcript_28239/g.79715  ORF Transcript_28239/g.79715 Transcript_28239/m.79715 type:complete len:199 (+) Transcript_28239:216-812(+)
MEGHLQALDGAWNQARSGDGAPNMAEYMANQYEWSKQEARVRAARQMRQRAAERQRDTEEFLDEVDQAMRNSSQRCRPSQPPYEPSSSQEPREKQAEDADFQELLQLLKEKRKETLAKNQAEQKQAERQRKEDMEWLHQMWEASVDSSLEQEREQFEREREARREESHQQLREHLDKTDDMLAAAKAEMEAIMAQMRA